MFCGGGDAEWGDGCEICKGWRGGLDPSCKKEEEEECLELGERESSGNLNVNNERGNLEMHRKMEGIPGIMSRNLCPGAFESFKMVAVKSSPIVLTTRFKINIK